MTDIFFENLKSTRGSQCACAGENHPLPSSSLFLYGLHSLRGRSSTVLLEF